MRSFIPISAGLVLASSALAFTETVYLIRHGEKPADGGVGLSSAGEDRAQCLRNVFGASSSYNIGYVLTRAYSRPYSVQSWKDIEFCVKNSTIAAQDSAAQSASRASSAPAFP